MRSKKFKFLIALLLILVLTFSLVACVNTDKEPEGDDEVELSVPQLIDEMSQLLEANLTIGNPRALNIDVVGDASLSETEGSNRLWRYEAIIKANIGLGGSSKPEDTTLRLEVNSYKKNAEGGEDKTTLFALLYESEVNAEGKYTGSYFYVVLPGSSTPLKINGMALLKLIPGVDEDFTNIKASDYFGIVANIIFDTGVKTGTGYKFTVDMFQVWSFVYSLIGDPAQLESLIGMDISPIITEIDKIIPEIFGNLTYKGSVEDDASTPDVDESETLVDKSVSDFKGLMSYVDQNLPSIKADVAFNFSNKKFAGATVDAVYQARNAEGVYNNPTHKFNLNLSKMYIGVGSKVAYDEGFIIDANARKAMAPTGSLLTFSIDGRMYLDDKMFNITIDSDLNPLVLLDGFDFGSLGTLGYFSLVVTKEDNSPVLTLRLDPDKKALVVSYTTPESHFITSYLNIGGVFYYKELGEYVNIMNGTTPNAQTVADTEDAGQDIVGIILNAFLDRLDISDIANNGVVINDIPGVIDLLFASIDLGLGSNTNLVTGMIKAAVFAGGKTLRLAVNEGGFKYGTFDTAPFEDINMSAMRDSDIMKMIDPTAKKVTSSDINTKYERGEAFKINLQSGKPNANNTFTVSGKNYDGEDATFPVVYYGNTFNPNVSGSQTVKVYYGLNSKLPDSLGLINTFAPGVIPDNLPLYGVYCMEVVVDVYAPVQNDNALLVINGSTGMLAGEDIAANLNAKLRYRDDWNNIREVAVTNDMISCNKPVIEGGKFLYLGKYNITVTYKGIKVTQTITVAELQILGMPGKLEIGKTLFELAEFKLRQFNDLGEIVSIDAEGLKVLAVYKKGALTTDIKDQIFDENGVLIPNMANKSTEYHIDIAYQVGGGEKVKRVVMSGFRYDHLKISSLPDGSVTLGVNSTIENHGFMELGKFTLWEYQESTGKDKFFYYNIMYDKSAEEFIAYKTVDGARTDLAEPFTVEITSNGTFDEATGLFVDTVIPTVYDVKTSGTTLPVGRYAMKVSYKGVFGIRTLNVYPAFYTAASYADKNVTTLTSLFKLNIDTTVFDGENEPANNKSLAFYFDKTAQLWKLGYYNKVSSANVEVPASVLTYSLNILMQDGDNWVAPTYKGTSGGFNYESDNTLVGNYRYVPYKVTFTMTFNGVEYSFDKIINNNNVPK